jgi:arylformamidase
MPVYPGTPEPEISEKCSILTEGFKESSLNILTHTGTHIDAPAHIFSKGKTIDQYACEKFYGPAIVIDCRQKSSINANSIHAQYNPSIKTDFILFYTGWSLYWGNEKYFHDFPVLMPDAAKLIGQLPIKGVGIDAISFDQTNDSELPNHKILLEKEIILIENLCNLDLLLNKNFILSCLPLKIKGVDGSPVRACGITED